jgi:chromate reductase
VLKNAVDWASRPPLGSPLTGKPVAIMGASTGRGGTARAQEQLRAALEFSRATVLEQPEVLVPEAFMRFDEHGELVDPGIRAELAELVDSLVHVAGGVTLAA